MEAFQEAYDSIAISENGYAGLRTGFLEALDSLPNRFERVQSLIEDFKVITDDIGTEFMLLNKSISVLTAINTTHADTYQLALASLQVYRYMITDSPSCTYVNLYTESTRRY